MFLTYYFTQNVFILYFSYLMLLLVHKLISELTIQDFSLFFPSLLCFQSVDLEVLLERIKQDYLEVQRMFLELRDSPPVRFPIFPFPLILPTFFPTLISSPSPHLHIYLRFCLSLSGSLSLLTFLLSLSLIHTHSLPTHTSSASLSLPPPEFLSMSLYSTHNIHLYLFHCPSYAILTSF